MSIDTVGIIGSGTMGRGIAQLAVQKEFDTIMQDVDEEIIDKAIEELKSNLDAAVEKDILSENESEKAKDRIETTTDMDLLAEKADIIIECVPEKVDLKKEIFKKLDRKSSEDTILTTNTSSLSVMEIASETEKPERVLGLHFFNPAYIMELLEVVITRRTEENIVEKAIQFGKDLDRKPVTINDYPGFVSARLSMALAFEAARLVQEGVASAEDIDEIMEEGYNHAMGPLKTGDLVGWDVREDIGEYLYQEFGESHLKPPMIIKNMVRAGDLGKKTGKGFYEWDD